MSEYEGIAIIGMAGRFPGADSVEDFWANLVAGKEGITFFSDAELAESGLCAEALRRGGQYVPARGVLKDAECFDAAFFGIHPKEAEVMDPQHRVFLEVCWAALERAGYAPSQMHCAVGVFAGASPNTYFRNILDKRPDLIELVGPDLVMFGNEKDYLATRVAYTFGLKGPAVNIGTACSTSLVAVCQACQSLLTYQCDMALAGATSVRVPQKSGYYYQEGNIKSRDGHTRTFDAHSAGTVSGNGAGVVVLKRLADAVNDGDQIYAVIKGAALNNDGSQRVSFTAPGVEGQSEVISMAHALAGVDPETITYVEAHGTATPLGDPIEVAALTKAFRLGTQTKQFCAIGSVKSNVGHLDVAAGVAGLIKTSLALRNKLIPPSLHFTKPNPKLDIENSPFYVNAVLREWKTSPGVPLRAGVSSFGMGGTNAHVVLEETPELPLSGPSRPWQLLTLSAKTADALDRATANLSQHLKQVAVRADVTEASRELADAAFTLKTGRSEFIHRRIVACQDAPGGAALLDAGDTNRVFTRHEQDREPPVVFMFPGQGAQYPKMGAELYDSEPVFRAEVNHCAELLLPLLQVDLRTIMFPADGSEKDAEQRLVQTQFTQPALFVIEYALAKLWMSWGIKPAAMIGHSVGEYVAGCLAGVFTLEDALSLVARRGALVQAQPGGAMLSVRLPEKELLNQLNGNGQMEIAAVNSPTLCVVAGPYEAIAALEKKLASQDVVTRQLRTSHAFHSPMMEPVLAPFTELLRQVRFNEPQIPYVSNVTARWITGAEAQTAEYWAGHVRQTVRFADGLAELMKEPARILLEVGPGQTLCTLARQHSAKSAEQMVLSSLPPAGVPEARGILEALGRLWMAGVAVDWQGFYANERRRRAVLPTYPFERTRYWPEPAVTGERLPTPVAAPAELQGGRNSAPIAATDEIQPQFKSPAMPASPAETKPEVPRKERLLVATRSLLQELTGNDFSGVDASANFLELGLDSLSLTQAALLFQRKFGVSISFRQLMEELCSFDAIASHLDATLPPEAFAEKPAPLSPEPPVTTALSGSQGEALEELLRQQQQLTNKLLQLMGREPTTAAIPAPTAAPAISTPPAGEMKSHGPFKPISRGADMVLSPIQRRALDAMIARYTARTGGSKKLAAQNRPVLADPRSVSGFKQMWKEMVYPIVTKRSDGSKVWDVDANEYVDFVMGFGASLFGHRPPFVVEAVHKQLDQGFEVGPIQPLAGEVAALVSEFTGMKRVVFANTGSEAVMAAIRSARAVTGREKIVVFAGSYHGVFDEVLFRPMAGNKDSRTVPIAPGIPGSAVSQVIVLDYGNPQSLEILRARGSEIAAVLVEPVQGRRLDFVPKEFLQELRRVTEQTGTALIFDEVVTGFRIHRGGAQAYFGIRADMATYGKVVGGGLPIGLVAGSAKFMDALDGGQWQYGDTSFPEVGVTFFAGTFVRHPLVLAAAKAVLTYLKQQGPELQQKLNDRTEKLANELHAIIDEFHAPYHLTQFGSFMHLTFPPEQRLAGLLFYLLRERGIHVWENRAIITTTAHTDQDFARLKRALRESLSEMYAGEFLPPPVESPGTKGLPSAPPPKTPAGDDLASTAAGQSKAGGAFPLTESQREIWLAAQMGGAAAVAYNESLRFEFHGAFDVEVFRAALGQVLQRHPILLASISPDGQSQQVRTDYKLDVPLLDFRGQDKEKKERELTAMLEREVSEPFDLVAGPMLRVKIACLSDDHYVVIWTAHHIICDGWSVGILVRELATIYSALKKGIQPVLPAPASFREYALENQSDRAEARDAVAFWSKQFAEIPPPLELPTDRPRPAIRSAKAASHSWIVDASVQESLKRIAGQQRTTLVVVLLAALKGLFCRLTGETDLVVALAVAGQAVSGKTRLVGQCVNTLPIRTRLNAEESFLENVKAVRKSVLDAYEHNQCSLGSIVQHLHMTRNLSRPPLVDVYFNVDRDTSDVKFEGVEFACAGNPKPALHFDLFFNLIEKPNGLSILCTYNTDLFDDATIARWLKYYETLIRGIAANPTEALVALPLLPESERKELIVGRNRTQIDFPKQKTLTEWFESRVEETPDAEAVAFENDHLTYGELSRRATQLAHRLKKVGVGPNVLVGLSVERSLDMLVALLGILRSGGAYVPLDPSFPEDRLAYMVEDSGMQVLVTHRGLEERLRVRPDSIIRLDSDWEDIAKESTDHGTLPGADPERLAYVLYTSGSTGKPKGVEIQHSALINLLLSVQREPGFTAKDTMLAVTTLSFDIAGLEIYLPLISGGKVAIASYDESRDPKRLMERIRHSNCSVMQATPATWRALVDAGWGGSSTLKILCGGESAPRDLVKELLPRCMELWNMYGPTETTIWSTVHSVTSAEGPIPIGRPIANTQTFVLDAHRNPVPDGAVGELFIGGAGLARGYLHRPELTQERFIESPFEPGARLYRTGDLARWIPGSNLECLGRVDNQVKLRGFRIELGEIEAALSNHATVGQCVVIAREDNPGDKRLVAYFELRPGTLANLGDLKTHLAKSLPDYMIPSIFVPLEKLPLTPNGKIDRNALPAPAGQHIEIDGGYVAPRDPLEQALARIWAKVLKVKRVGVRDNFFDLGGHSLTAVRMLAEVQKLAGKNLPLATLFQASTVESFAELLRRDGWTPSWSSLVPIQPLGQKPLLFLVHGAEGNVLLYRQLSQYLGTDQPVYGLQSKGLGGDGSLNVTVEDMASQYVKEIRTVQPHGPYFLGGYCLGGTIAFEMAQQLSAMGEPVGLVMMLGAYNQAVARSFVLKGAVHFIQNLWFHGANLASIPMKDGKRFLKEKMDTELERFRIRLHAAYHSFQSSLGRKATNGYPYLAVTKANDQALYRYVPRTYGGRVAVIREKGYFLGHSSPTFGWDEIVPNGLEVRELPVRPKGMLVEPFCRLLAEAVKSCLQNDSNQ
jgi:amino acid adenylation domain-containing protein